MLLNLALNAADAMPDGGTLTVATTEVQLPRDIGAQGDFPVAKAAAPATDVPEPVLRSTPARGLVMVVEDEPAGRTMVARVLQEEGYEVVSAQDGQEALSALVKRNGVRLVVSDVAMPVMSGRELGDTLALTHPDLPVLYMSGFADAEIISRGLLAPGRPFIQKPFATDLFARRVAELLQQRDR